MTPSSWHARLDARGVVVTDPQFPDYEALQCINLPNALAKVTHEKAALKFADRFGPLGYEDLYALGEDGEPIRWVLAHANGVRLAVRLLAALAEKDEAQVTAVLESDSLVGAFPKTSGDPIIGQFLVGDGGSVRVWEPVLVPSTVNADGVEYEGLLYQATSVVCDLVNLNTDRIPHDLRHRGSEFHEGVRPGTLVEAIWWHVGQWALSGRVRQCENCGTPFLVTDARQVFCPGVDTYREQSGRVRTGRSICAAVSQQRKAREERRRASDHETKLHAGTRQARIGRDVQVAPGTHRIAKRSHPVLPANAENANRKVGDS